MSDSGDDFGGLGATTPNIPRTKPSSRSSQAVAGPSKARRHVGRIVSSEVREISDEDIQEVEPRGGRRKRGEPVEEEDDEEEVQAVEPPPPTKQRGGSRKPASNANGRSNTAAAAPATVAVAKGKGKAKAKPGTAKSQHAPMDVDAIEVYDDMDADMGNGAVGLASTIHIAAKGGRAATGQTAATGGTRDDEGKVARLSEQLRQAASHIEDLKTQMDELYQVRQTEPEQLLERMEAQYQAQLQANEALINDLTAKLTRKEPTHQRGKTAVFELLTREEVNKETEALQKQVSVLKSTAQQAQQHLKEKDEEIAALRQTQRELTVERDQEIERGKTLANKLQRQPHLGSASRSRAGGLTGTDDPKYVQIVKFYEDLTNLLVPTMRLQKGKYLDMDEWVLGCVYSFTDIVKQKENPHQPAKSINFTLSLCKDVQTGMTGEVTSPDQLVDSVRYSPLHLENENSDFLESLGFLGDTFTFERSQLSLFLRTLYDHMSDEGNGDEEEGEGASDDDIQIVER
ncbi:hypothetical protein B0H34DRAFT_795235 [Crassisporium funariophilum]|nr:hypothetical protein B0H34DRAFT_795235 [Crassisporium funariophilum]